MSKTAKKDFDCDREKLVALVQKSMGTSSIRSFANQANVGTALIARLSNSKFQGDPMPETLIKIARASEGRVSIPEILTAGGYDCKKYENFKNQTGKDTYELNCNNTFVQKLSGEGFRPFTYETGHGNAYNLKMYCKVPDDGKEAGSSDYPEAYIYYKYLYDESESTNKQLNLRRLLYIYGEAHLLNSDYVFKTDGNFPQLAIYTIVTNNETIYNVSVDNPPLSSSLLFQICLTDCTGENVIKSEYLSTPNADYLYSELYDSGNLDDYKDKFSVTSLS